MKCCEQEMKEVLSLGKPFAHVCELCGKVIEHGKVEKKIKKIIKKARKYEKKNKK